MDTNYKTLSEFPNYSISTSGVIYSDKLGRCLKSSVMNTGYYQVELRTIEGKRKGRLVHRLLAQAFIPNPHNKPTVNHIDGDKLNNRLDNLEWNTYKENNQHAVDTGLMIKDKPVLCTTTGEIFKSATIAANILSISRPNISNACAGRRLSAGKTSSGLKRTWKFLEEHIENEL